MSEDISLLPALTMREIRNRFPNEWVLIAEPKLNEKFEVLLGRVVAHAKDRDEVYRQLACVSGQSLCIEYTGPVPADLAVIL